MTVTRGFTRIQAPRMIPSSSPSPRVVRASQTGSVKGECSPFIHKKSELSKMKTGMKITIRMMSAANKMSGDFVARELSDVENNCDGISGIVLMNRKLVVSNGLDFDLRFFFGAACPAGQFGPQCGV